MDFRYISRILSGLLIFAVLAGFFVNICYQVVADNVKQVETVENVSGSVRHTVTADATVIRREKPLFSDSEGLYLYSVSDGEKVQNNKAVVEIYDDNQDNSQLVEEIGKLKNEISVLESAENLESSYTISGVEKQISLLTLELTRYTQQGNISRCQRISDLMRVMLCIRELKNGRADYSDRIKQLNEQLKTREGALGKPAATVKADQTGYYYYDCDGYESKLGELDPMSMSLEQIDGALNAVPDATDKTAGKLVLSHKWYMLVPLSNEASMSFSESKEYLVSIEGLSNEIPMNVERVVRKAGNARAFLVLSYDGTPDEFDFSRKCRVQITYESFEGFKIPVLALTQLEGYTGVYILHGSVVEFRRVSVLVMDDVDVICDALFAPTEGNYKSLKFYDKIIVKGEKLYVGKIID